jgi:hypothetical protein
MAHRRAAISRRGAAFLPCAPVEPLEGRLLLSTSTVNAGVVVRTVAPQLLGINVATWDGLLSNSTSLQLAQSAGLTAIRLPGGSSSDVYHFNVNSGQSIGQMAEFGAKLNATTIATINYGSGSPEEGVAMWAYLCGATTDTTAIGMGPEFNTTTNTWTQVNWNTVGYWASLRAASPLHTDDGLNFLRLGSGSSVDHPGPFTITDWEVGNEEYGTWEEDGHNVAGDGLTLPNGAAHLQHDPTTYVAFAKQFATQVRSIIAAEGAPAILIGVDSQATDTSFNNWIANVLKQGKSQGFIPDFISDHVYDQSPGDESDAGLLADPNVPPSPTPANSLDWAQRAAAYKAIITANAGSAGANIQLLATEINSVYTDPGKQSTSLVNGLFIADSIGSLMETAYNGAWVWDLHNGGSSAYNDSASLYGWREYGDYGILGSGSGGTTSNETSPNYFAEQLASKIVQSGGKVVSATSDSSLMDTFAVLEPNGHLDLLVVNKNPPSAGPPDNLPDPSITQTFKLQNFVPSGQATLWQYGVVQDDGQDTSGSAALRQQSSSLSVSGGAFNLAIPDYSMTVVDLAPALSLTAAVMYLKLDSDGQHVDIWNNAADSGAYSQQLLASQIGAMTITATAGSTGPFIFDLSNGNFLPANTMSFVGSGGDALQLIGTGGNDTLVFATTSLSIGGASLNFSGNSSSTFNPNGGTDALSLSSGATLQLAAPPVGTGDLVRQLSSLTIASGAELQLADAGAGGERELVVISSLSIASANNTPAAKFDLGDNDVDLVGASSSFTTLTTDIASGLNLAAAAASPSALWQGPGICTDAATAANDRALGMIVNYNNGAPLYGTNALDGQFDTYNPGMNDVLIRYTFNGDADLTGSITAADYLLTDDGFNRNLSGWLHGDFNYDGVINGDDYSLLDNSFNSQNLLASPQALIAPLASSLSAATAAPPPPTVDDLTAKGFDPPATRAAAVASPFISEDAIGAELFNDSVPIEQAPPPLADDAAALPADQLLKAAHRLH